MTRLKLSAFLLFATFASASSTCLAQVSEGRQTVENAQKFLAKVLPGSVYTSPHISKVLREVGGRYADIRITHESSVSEVRTLRRCVTLLRYAYPSDAMIVVTMSGQRESRPISEIGSDMVTGRGDPDGIDFAHVRRVKRYGNSVSFFVKGDDGDININLGGEEMAERVRFAIEFLIASCDPAGGTGF